MVAGVTLLESVTDFAGSALFGGLVRATCQSQEACSYHWKPKLATDLRIQHGTPPIPCVNRTSPRDAIRALLRCVALTARVGVPGRHAVRNLSYRTGKGDLPKPA